jgi:hypothetical protein
VSLSAEDRHKADGQLPHAAVDDESGHDHHDNDVDKVTAFKFLLAGGVAGAGSSATISHATKVTLLRSFKNCDRSLRQAQNLPCD